jgi:hypothetical protein
MTDTNKANPQPAVEVTEEGTNRILKVGDYTITIDKSGSPQTLEYPPGIFFDLDKFLVKLILFSDKLGNAALRDILLTLRPQLAEHPDLVKELQKVCANCVVLNDTDWVRIERAKWDQFINKLRRAELNIDPDNSPLYVGDDIE